MDFDEDGDPPELVDMGFQLADEEKPVKVPITIVTGTVNPVLILVSTSKIIGQDISEQGRQLSLTTS